MIVDLTLKRLQSRESSIIDYVECKERILLCIVVFALVVRAKILFHLLLFFLFILFNVYFFFNIHEILQVMTSIKQIFHF